MTRITALDRSTRSTFLRRATITSLAFAGLPALAGRAEAAVGTATGEVADISGTLNFLNFEGWIGKSEIAAFERRYPNAKVNSIPWTSTDDSLAKAKNRSGDVDLFLMSLTEGPPYKALDLLAPLGTGAPNIKNVDARFRKTSFDPQDRFFVGTDYGHHGIVYRKDKVKSPPRSWAEFFKVAPTHAGKIAVLDYRGPVIASALYAKGLSPISTKGSDLQQAEKVLRAFKPHVQSITTGVRKQLVTGEAVLGIADAYDAYNATKLNKRIGWIAPAEGLYGYLEGLCILDGPRNDLARAFVNFHLKRRNYADFINTVGAPAVMPRNTLIKPAIRNNPILNPPADVRDRITFNVYLGEAQKLWRRTWDAFKAA
jgi:spermidine/putrescine transport system substrate-binding protein